MIARTQTVGMVTYNRRPRGLWGNLSSVLLQPVAFFRAFPVTRQWLWVALLILILTGVSAVHQPVAQEAPQTAQMPQVVAPPISSGSISGPEGGFVAPPDLSGASSAEAAPDVSKTVMTGLLAAGGVLLAWLIQALALCEVSMINGKRPSFGMNLQIAIWASVPLALMLLIQQIYFGIGGGAGEMGLALLLERWEGFKSLPTFSQTVLLTLATNFTLFWLWNLVLIYLGGRYVLNGRRAAVMLIVVAWVILSALLPALTSGGKPQASDTPAISAPMDMHAEMPQEIVPTAPSEGERPARPMKG